MSIGFSEARIAHLEAELGEARARIAHLEAPPAPAASPPSDAELPVGAERDQLQLRDQRLREGPAPAASPPSLVPTTPKPKGRPPTPKPIRTEIPAGTSEEQLAWVRAEVNRRRSYRNKAPLGSEVWIVRNAALEEAEAWRAQISATRHQV